MPKLKEMTREQLEKIIIKKNKENNKLKKQVTALNKKCERNNLKLEQLMNRLKELEPCAEGLGEVKVFNTADISTLEAELDKE